MLYFVIKNYQKKGHDKIRLGTIVLEGYPFRQSSLPIQRYNLFRIIN